MQKLLIRIFVGIFTISFGVTAAFLWNLFFVAYPQVEVEENKAIICQIIPKQITDCQVEDIPPSYNGKLISIKATVHLYQNQIVMLPVKPCIELVSNDFQMIVPRLELKGFSGHNSNLKELLEKPRLNSSEANETDIQVIGVVKRYYDRNHKPQYLIIPNTIELLTPIRKFESGGAAE